jgi:hypothetical protein
MKLSDLDPKEVSKYVPSDPSDMDPQSAVASQGLQQGAQALYNSEPIQNAITGAPAKQVYEDALAAGRGDREAEARVALNSMNLGMGTIEGPKPKMVPKGTFKNKFSVDAYHGTKADIDAFSKHALGQSTGAASARKAFFFAEDPSTASDYAKLSPSGISLRKAVDDREIGKDLDGIWSQLKEKYGDKAEHPDGWNNLLERYTPEQLQSVGYSKIPENEPLLKQWNDISTRLDDNNMHESPHQYIHRTDPVVQGLMKEHDDVAAKLQSMYDKNKPWDKQSKSYKDLANKVIDLRQQASDYTEQKVNSGQNVLPVKLRMENPYTHDFKDLGYRDESYSDIIDKAKAAGHDSVIFKNTYDPADRDNRVKQNIYAVFEPHQVRSKFAEFDPKKAKSGKLSYAHGGVVGGTLSGSIAPPLKASQLNSNDIELVAEDPLQAKYGTIPQQALAGVEGAARGVSLGSSDYLEQQLEGLSPEFSKEAISGRQEANPGTAFTGNVLGGAALIAGTGGLAAPIEAGLGGGMLARAAGFATEGGLFGLGSANSESALGDPNMNASKVLAHIGMGAALGGGLGIISGGLSKALMKKAPGSVPIAEAVEAEPVVDIASPPGKAPSTLADMEDAVENARKYGGQDNLNEIPQKQIALDANQRLGAKMGDFPVMQAQLDSLNSQDARNTYKTLAELPGKEGQVIRNFEGAQKKQAIRVIDNAIQDEIAPGYTPTTKPIEAGERVSDSLTDVIQGVRDEVGPAIKAIKETPLNDMDHLPGVMEYLTDTRSSPRGNPNIANMFDHGGDQIAIKPYKTSMGIDKATYTALKNAVEALEENPKDFEQLFNIRKGLSQHVDVTQLGDAAKEIGNAKAALMDYIQDAIQSQDPDLAVRDTFARYAKNEEAAQFIEKQLGAEIGSGNFRSLAKGKADEYILNKIFANSETVRAVKALLPETKFNELLADRMAILRDKATTDGVFSSKNFTRFMNQGKAGLDEAFAGHPSYQDIQDAATLTRIFPDTVPNNPSGTAKTLLQGVENLLKHPLDTAAGFLREKLEGNLNAREINKMLAGQAEQSSKLDALQSVVKKVTDKLTSGAKSIFNHKDAIRGGALSGSVKLSDEQYEKVVKRLNHLTSNPQGLMDHVADNTQHIYQAAPNTSQALSTSLMQGVAFLSSKVPQPPATRLPLSRKWEPTTAQKMQFSQYYKAVDDPLSAFDQVKSGTLNNHTIEALQAVHPQLLQEMRLHTMEQMGNIEKAQALSYPQKLALSKFLGQPLDTNMTPLGITSNQMAMQAPSQSQQTTSVPGGGKTTLGGLKELNFSGRAQTTTQRRLDDK